jgi:hypothetical protein
METMKNATLALLLALGCGALAAVPGCSEESDAPDSVEDAAEEAGDAMEDAADATGDAMDDAADEAEDAMDEADDAVGGNGY